MRNQLAAGLLISMAGLGLTATTAGPASADPSVPCGSRSTYISSGDYFNLTYKNCESSTRYVVAHDELHGEVGGCRSVGPGQWISWTRLTAPAWQNNWTARPC